MPDELDDGGEGRGFYLQDAGYPQHLAWILHVLAAPQTLWRWRAHGWYLVKNWMRGSPDTDVTGHIADLLESAELSAGGLPLLGMGRDVPDGRMYLHKGKLDLDWKSESPSAYFERLRTTSRGFAALARRQVRRQPDLVPAPRDHRAPARRLRRWAAPPSEGVVDPYGNVFGYPGLHIADGSVMPGPVGPNPSFTIAALADRFADRILETTPAAEATAT